jgi:hypothetical protein
MMHVISQKLGILGKGQNLCIYVPLEESPAHVTLLQSKAGPFARP